MYLSSSYLNLETNVETGLNCIFSVVHVCLLIVSYSATPWTVAHQAPLSMGFPKQEYWSGLPFPSLGDLPNLGIKPGSPVWQADSLPLSHLGSPRLYLNEYIYLSPNSGKI